MAAAGIWSVSRDKKRPPGARIDTHRGQAWSQEAWRNRIGQVMTTLSSAKTLHTPSGSSFLFFVHFAALKGQTRSRRCRIASGLMLSTGKPKTSARGCLAMG